MITQSGLNKLRLHYKTAGHDQSVTGVIHFKYEDKEIWTFSARIRKYSGLFNDGVRFDIQAGEHHHSSTYKIGGEFGSVILGESLLLKPYHLYKHNMIYTGSIICQPNKNINEVEIVIVDKQHHPLVRQKAQFKEYTPYNGIEIWEYAFKSIDVTDCLFYLEYYRSGSCLKENNFGECYKFDAVI